MCRPAARPVTVWRPLVAVLLSPVPLTVTAVASALDQVISVAPGAVAAAGAASIAADTTGGAATVTVWLRVAEVAPVASTAWAVKVSEAGPVAVAESPASLSVPLPPPAEAKSVLPCHTRTCVRFPSPSWPRAETA